MSNNPESAAEFLRITLDRFPTSFAALNNLIIIYNGNADTASADAAIEAFRSKNRGNPALLQRVDDMIDRLARASKSPENPTGTK